MTEPTFSIQDFIYKKVKNLADRLAIASGIKKQTSSQQHSPQQRDEEKQCGKKAVKHVKYRTYSTAFKKKAVADVAKELEESPHYLSLTKIIKNKSRNLGIHPKNLQRWYKAIKIERKDGRRKAAYPQMEEKLIEFVKQHPKIKRREVIACSKKIMKEIDPNQYQKFAFSKGWYERFKTRYARKQEDNQQEQLKARNSAQIKEDLSKIKLEASQIQITTRLQKTNKSPSDSSKKGFVLYKNSHAEPLADIQILRN